MFFVYKSTSSVVVFLFMLTRVPVMLLSKVNSGISSAFVYGYKRTSSVVVYSYQ